MNEIELSVYLADIEPMKRIMYIVNDLVRDDRVPIEYRLDILKAISPWLNEGTKLQIKAKED